MSDDGKCYAATPAATLEEHILNSNIAKSDTEWWAHHEITRLRADLAAALAECERLNKSRNQWGKKYNDCLGKLRLAVMSDSDECKELTAQNNNLRAENERMREALSYYAEEDYNGYNGNGACARAALEGVTEPAKGDSNA